MNRIVMDGCTADTMYGYLKSLGLASAISRYTDEVRICWDGNRLILETHMTREDIRSYMLNDYRPLPIMSPWSVKKHREVWDVVARLLQNDKAGRFSRYVEMCDSITIVEKEFNRTTGRVIDITGGDSPNGVEEEHMLAMLTLCRNHFPDDVISWLDAAIVIGRGYARIGNVDPLPNGVNFAPLCGSEGSPDMVEDYVKCLEEIFVRSKRPAELLDAALSGRNTVPESVGMTGRDPMGAGRRPNGNGGSGMDAASDPWTWIFVMEGITTFAGNPVRHHLSGSRSKAAFPFTYDATVAGHESTSKDDLGGRIVGEIWTPLWDRPSTVQEIRHVFGDGRVGLFGRDARAGIEFMMAVRGVGVDHGISRFNRFVIRARNGKNLSYVNMGSIGANNSKASPLMDIDEISRAAQNNRNMDHVFKCLVREHEAAQQATCTTGHAKNFIRVLASTGMMEAHLSIIRPRWFTSPLTLSWEWLISAYDESPEFRLAASIASIRNSADSYHIRENLEPIRFQDWPELAQDGRRHVWNVHGDTLHNLEHVVLQRGIDGVVDSMRDTVIPARLDDINRFVKGRINTRKLGSLILPLSMVQMSSDRIYPWKGTGAHRVLPGAYAMIRLALMSYGNNGIETRYDPRILNLLCAGNCVRKATSLAALKLRSSGAVMQNYVDHAYVADTAVSGTVEKNLLASMLFPINYDGMKILSEGILEHVGANAH